MTPTLTKALGAVCRVTGFTPAELLGSARRRDWALARQVVWYAANVLGGLTQAAIARQVGRDHTTIRWAVCRITLDLSAHDPHVTDIVGEVWRLMDDPDYRPRVVRPEPAARRSKAPPVKACPPVPGKFHGDICSPEWWASNDASFRAGMARAAALLEQEKRQQRVATFTHMGKTVRNLPVVESSGKSGLALPRNLCHGLQRSTHTTHPEHTQR